MVSIAVSALVFALVVAVLISVKTPRYRVTWAWVKELLGQVVVGQARDNDWRLFIAYQIRDNPELEAIRQQCQEIDDLYYRSQGDYLLTKRGLALVRELLDQMPDDQANQSD